MRTLTSFTLLFFFVATVTFAGTGDVGRKQIPPKATGGDVSRTIISQVFKHQPDPAPGGSNVPVGANYRVWVSWTYTLNGTAHSNVITSGLTDSTGLFSSQINPTNVQSLTGISATVYMITHSTDTWIGNGNYYVGFTDYIYSPQSGPTSEQASIGDLVIDYPDDGGFSN